MMQKKRRWPMALAGLAFVSMAGTALAFGGHHGKGGCDRNAMRAVYEVEGLTDAQKEKLEALRDQQREAFRTLRDASRDDRRALRDAMERGASLDEVRPLAEKQGKHVTEMIMLRAEMRQKLNAILTPEQQKQLKSEGYGPGFGHPPRRDDW